MRTFKAEGIVIRRRNINDADRILTVFTREHGKIQIKASGVRKINSRRSSHVELLNHSMLNLYRGTIFSVLTEAQTISTFPELKVDLQKIGFAYHMCELIDGLCPEQMVQNAVFSLMRQTLQRMCSSDDIVYIMHEFEVSLLTLLGYWDTKKSSLNFDTNQYIEYILEKKLKSKRIFSKL